MKRIFKKTPVVDPLPPPSSQPPSNPPSGRSTPGHQGGRSIAALFGGGAPRESVDYDNAQQHSRPQQQQHTSHHDHGKWGFGMHHQAEVTPFPSDAREKQTPSTVGGKAVEGSIGPLSMLDIKQMQERRDQERSQTEDPASRDSRRRGQPQQPPPIHPGQRTSRGYQSSPSPDGWTVVPAPNGASPGAPVAGFEGPYPQHSLPIPNASFSQQSQSQNYPQSHSSANSSPSSQSTHTTMFLPPGARPPTPPTSRPPYPIHMRYSQSNLKQSTTPGTVGGDNSEGKAGRERGYSSPVMTTRVDGQDGVAIQHTVPRDGSAAKLQKQQPANLRSPLAHTYPTLSPADNTQSFPSPRPYTLASGAATPTQQTQPSHYPRDQPHRGIPTVLDLPNPYIPVDDQMHGNKDLPAPPKEEQQAPDHEKAKDGKKKFWGISVKSSDRKNKKAQAENHASGHGSMQSVSLQPNAVGDWRQSVDEARRSSDGRGLDMIDSRSTSTHGHIVSHNEEETKGRLLGLEFNKRENAAAAQVNDVASAIQILCTSPDPSPSAIYEVCDRINHSGQGESIAKEAARALRKEFKYGDEVQRRSAGKVWFVLMRNITIKGFKTHATNKKFIQALEPILTTPAAKSTVSLSTRKLLTDILADLTHAYGMDKECGGLIDLWKKVKLPQEPEFGRPMPQDHPIYSLGSDQPPISQMANLQVRPAPASQSSHNSHVSQPTSLPPPPRPPRSHAEPGYAAGPGYTDLPSHTEDIRKLQEECTAAKESAKLLGEALLYTRPEELEYKPVIQEFYPKVFHAHTSLTNQMDWAQAEASQSRERLNKSGALTIHDGPAFDTQGPESTLEERALATLFETHAMLAEVIKQHDELERMAADEKELREVRERSKKDTRMDRGQQMQMLSVGPTAGAASSSRSPSPTPAIPLPPVQPAPQAANLKSNNPFRSTAPAGSRSPSPDRHHLPHIPRSANSPSTGLGRVSPLGGAKLRMGPRPLPNPSKASSAVPTPSQTPAPGTTASSHGGSQSAPSRSGTGDSNGISNAGMDEEDIDGDDLPKIPLKPSRKALGKRRAIVDEDNNFDPNELFNPKSTDPRHLVPSSNNGLPDEDGSDESILLGDDIAKAKPVVYAYDAYEERQKELKRLKELEERARASSGFGGGSGGSRMFA
ncbi:hypothetical protein IAR50_006291 [Cryptococcus sp. DSM 104548]